jgi:hypothetical protein
MGDNVRLFTKVFEPNDSHPHGGYAPVGPLTPLPVTGIVTVAHAGAFAGNYETVAASQTGQVLGGAGAKGDYLATLTVIPTSVSPGAIAILDGATSVTVFAGGANALSNLVPFQIPIGMYSVNGAWSVTTGAGLSVVATGSFT